MGTLLSCLCAGSQPPYDRLTLIYAAAVELSGETSFPATACVAAQPPLRRLGYIYAVFREISGDTSLPSQECVEAEPYADQVSRIYEAVFAYAADDTLADARCVRGRPIWQQFLEVYRALYVAAGSPDELTDPRCVQIQPSLDILTHVYCAILQISVPCVIPTLVSATIEANGETLTLVFSEEVTGTGAGFLMNLDSVQGFGIVYVSGSGTDTLVFTMDETAIPGEGATLEYDDISGDMESGPECPLASFTNFPVTNNTGTDFTFLRPGGVDSYFRPDGTSIYIRP